MEWHHTSIERHRYRAKTPQVAYHGPHLRNSDLINRDRPTVGLSERMGTLPRLARRVSGREQQERRGLRRCQAVRAKRLLRVEKDHLHL